MAAAFFNAEQLTRLTAAHRIVCGQRDIRLGSKEGMVLAMRLLTECTGDEPEDAIVRRFAH